MKTFKSFLKEENEENAHGILFLKDKNGNDTHAIVGTPHGQSPKISKDILKRIDEIRKKHGIYYEGDGGDVKHHEKLFGPKQEYKGTWDTLTIDKQSPPHWIHTDLFSNHKENNLVSRLLQHHTPGDRIIDTIRRSGENLASYDARGERFIPSEEHLNAFFEKMNMKNDAQVPTTKSSLSNFLNKGETKMWPSDWLHNKSPASALAREMVFARENPVFNRSGGVFVAGAGHILSMKELAKRNNITFDLIGGEKAL